MTHDPGCEVVLTPEEYSEFLKDLERPPRVIPELARLYRESRLKKSNKSGESEGQ